MSTEELEAQAVLDGLNPPWHIFEGEYVTHVTAAAAPPQMSTSFLLSLHKGETMTREEAEREFMESEAVVAGLSDDMPIYFLKCTFCNRTIKVNSMQMTVRCLYCGTAYLRSIFTYEPEVPYLLRDTNGDAWRKKFA